MKGTEKQVAWAEKIRKALAEKLDELEKKMGPAPEIVKQYIEKELAHDEAKYLIDTWKLATRDDFDLLWVLNEQCPDDVGDAAFDWECEYDMSR